MLRPRSLLNSPHRTERKVVIRSCESYRYDGDSCLLTSMFYADHAWADLDVEASAEAWVLKDAGI